MDSRASHKSVDLLGAQLAEIEEQVGRHTEGLRTITNSTYKQVEEHAAAIQRLTLVSGGDFGTR